MINTRFLGLSLVILGSTQVQQAAEAFLPSMNPSHVIKLLKPRLPKNPIILEAGAYDGSDSILLSKTWPESTIHSFEPVPDLFLQLERNARRVDNIICYQLALSNKDGVAEFILSEHPKIPGQTAQSSSLLQPKEHLKCDPAVKFNKKIMVQTTTLDTWAKKNNITRVDFLWLDLQGVELDVMKAAPFIMSSVKAVYVEVEFVEAYAKQALFNEVDSWLTSQGFKRIARDFTLPPAKRCWFGNCVYFRK
jgi:FkbM family methyltransferase